MGMRIIHQIMHPTSRTLMFESMILRLATVLAIELSTLEALQNITFSSEF